MIRSSRTKRRRLQEELMIIDSCLLENNIPNDNISNYSSNLSSNLNDENNIESNTTNNNNSPCHFSNTPNNELNFSTENILSNLNVSK